MENDEFDPQSKNPLPDPPYSRRKDPYIEPPIKDFSHLLNGKPLPKPTRRVGRTVLITLVVLILMAGGGGVYWKFFRAKPVMPVKHETAKTQSIAPKVTTTPTTNYTSAGFGVTLTYPKTWTITDGGTTSLSVISPVMQLTSASGQSVQGKIIMLFQPQGKVPPAFGTTDASAVLNSQLLEYSSPTSNQAAETYVSFVQYSSATVTGTLNGIYVTGNYGYQKDGPIPEANLTGLNPLITVTFGQCNDTACSNLGNLSISSNEWNNSSFSTPILDILKSLQFS